MKIIKRKIIVERSKDEISDINFFNAYGGIGELAKFWDKYEDKMKERPEVIEVPGFYYRGIKFELKYDNK